MYVRTYVPHCEMSTDNIFPCIFCAGSIPFGSKSEVEPRPTATVGSLSPPVLGAVIAVPIMMILFTGLIVATVSLLMWKR